MSGDMQAGAEPMCCQQTTRICFYEGMAQLSCDPYSCTFRLWVVCGTFTVVLHHVSASMCCALALHCYGFELDAHA